VKLQAKRIEGSNFTAGDKLEVVLDSDNQILSIVSHTIEVVSGVNVTHGGGGAAGSYLHYKSSERDVNADGIIDYSNVLMSLVQESQGSSIIKVICSVTTKDQEDTFNVEITDYFQRATDAGVTEELPNGTDGAFNEKPPAPTSTVLKTGDIILEWSEDTFV